MVAGTHPTVKAPQSVGGAQPCLGVRVIESKECISEEHPSDRNKVIRYEYLLPLPGASDGPGHPGHEGQGGGVRRADRVSGKGGPAQGAHPVGRPGWVFHHDVDDDFNNDVYNDEYDDVYKY